MPEPNLTFYDCCREGDPSVVGTQNVDLCDRWLRSQGIEYKGILANADGSLRLNLSDTKITPTLGAFYAVVRMSNSDRTAKAIKMIQR